jgi:hypothetical protein
MSLDEFSSADLSLMHARFDLATGRNLALWRGRGVIGEHGAALVCQQCACKKEEVYRAERPAEIGLVFALSMVVE